jgi:natural product precursor
MKTIKKLKLTTLSKNELENKRMKLLKGGYDWYISCGDITCNCGTLDPTQISSTQAWYIP